MERYIIADNKKIVLKTNALAPLIYKKEFGKDFFEDAVLLTKKSIDCEIAYSFIWTFAKIADDTIPEMWEWLSGFEEFPIADFVKILVEMVSACIYSKKKPNQTERTKMKKTRKY